MPSDATDAFRALLMEEREAILTGDLDALEGLAARKLAGLDRISADDVDQGLRDEADRNQRLIGASMAGLRSAIARLAEIRKVAGGLQGYDSDGRALTISNERATLRRRV